MDVPSSLPCRRKISVIVLNARKISVSAAKHDTKTYVRHSGYPQGLKEESLGKLLERLAP